MRVLKLIMTLAAVSAVCVAILVGFGTKGFSLHNGGAVGEAIGGGLLLVVGGLVAFGLSALIARDPSTPMKVGTGTPVLLTLMVAASSAQSPGSHVYTNSGCEHSVTFPVKPEIRMLTTPAGRFEEAQSLEGDQMLRALCLNYALSTEAAKQTLRNRITADGLSGGEVIEVSPQMIEARGSKLIAGQSATYAMKIYIGSNSTLLISVGSRSSQYPTSAISRFLGSVARTR